MGLNSKSLGILEEMAKEGVKPGVFVYTCMIQTCIQTREIKEAINMYDRMVHDSIKPDNVTYYTLIQGCLQQN